MMNHINNRMILSYTIDGSLYGALAVAQELYNDTGLAPKTIEDSDNNIKYNYDHADSIKVRNGDMTESEYMRLHIID